MKKLLIVAAASVMALGAAPADASTLPDAAIPGGPVLGVGLGPSLSLDFPLSDRASLGVAVGIPFYEFNVAVADARLMYRLTDRTPVAVSLLAGAFIGFGGKPALVTTPIGVEVGVGLSHTFASSPVTVRGNIVVGIPTGNRFPRFGAGFFSPSSGLELGYKFSPTIEGTLGFNGMGDVLGLRVML